MSQQTACLNLDRGTYELRYSCGHFIECGASMRWPESAHRCGRPGAV